MDTSGISKRKNSENEIQDHPDNQVNVEEQEEKLKYPKSVFFIVINEFCERFSFYGMRTVLALYLSDMLNYDNRTSTMIYHVFTCFVYFFPLLGAIISDSWLGKFRTIFYVSIIYAIGQLILAASAAPPLKLPAREFSMIGLFLIAIGTGGIKPCVSAFGGDQFVLPQQERYLVMFFSVFYFSINTGSLISTLLTPVIRDQKCFGDNCFSLAFLIPAILMILSIVIFVMGKRLYKIVEPSGNLIVKVSKCVWHAIYNKVKGKVGKREHWLDHADDKYEVKLIEDIKASLRVLKLFIPLPIFWALYDQQGSQWTFQAKQMDGQIGSFILLPDQMQAINPLLIIIFIPIFETCIYPSFAKIHFIDTPLKKLVVGGLIASVAFVAAGLVEMQVEKTYPVLPSKGSAQIRIFNTLNCSVTIKFDGTIDAKKLEINAEIKELDMWKYLEVKTNGQNIILSYEANFTNCKAKGVVTEKGSEKSDILIQDNTACSWIITPLKLKYFEDRVNRPDKVKPMIRSIIYLSSEKDNSNLRFVHKGQEVLSIPVRKSNRLHSELVELNKPDDYDVFLGKHELQKNVSFKLGGVYSIVGANIKNIITGKVITVTEPNSVHIAWLLPQYIIITIAEVMFSVTGLQFAFTQAPESMKSLLQAGWLLSVAFGNLIVVIITGSRPFQRQLYEIFLYAGLMAVVIAIFAVMTIFYKYVEIPEEEEADAAISVEMKKGNDNLAYKEDEKR